MKRLAAQPETPGVASVVIVNYRGADDTCTALAALRELRWPRERLEVIVVDNASGDGSVERIAKEHPEVEVLALDQNRGFAAGCDAGAQAATGQYLAFLNNDARPDPEWVSAATAVLDRDGSVACVASKVLDWDGELVDFVDAGLGFYGHGFKVHAGEPDSPAYDREADVLFASGAAMVARASTFRDVGGFDERYFLFVEALPGLTAARRALQAARRRADHEITRLFRLPMFSNVGDPEFVASFSAVVDALGADRIASQRRRIAVLTGDVLEPKMAGPAIRAWHMACTLAREHDVQLVCTQESSLSHPDFLVRVVDERELEDVEAWCDVMVFQGNLMRHHAVLRDTKKIVVSDIYDPFHLEVLEQARNLAPPARLLAVQSSTDVLNEQLRRGDFFLCASEKQRDFWPGQLASVGRLNPATS